MSKLSRNAGDNLPLMRTPQAIFFDFDGVILESLDVKTNAMAKLFAHRPEHVPGVVRYHIDHSGMPRHDKFRHYYAELFREPLSDSKMASLDSEFKSLIWESLLVVPFVRGALEFLKIWGRRIPLFVISAAPQEEVYAIVCERGLADFFQSVHGSPQSKTEHVRRLLQEHDLTPEQCLFVGDARADMEAALANGMSFIQRLTQHQPFPLEPRPAAVIDDLSQLSDLWENIAVSEPKTLWLAHVRESPRSLKRRLPSSGATWLYLGRDFTMMRRFERGFGSGFKCLDISKHLQCTAENLRQPYLSYLSELAEKNNSLEWWTSRIADENTLSGSLFSDICYLRTALDMVSNVDGPTLIIAESEGLLQAISGLTQGCRTDPFWKIWSRLRFLWLFLGRWVLFFLRGADAFWDARMTRNGPVILAETKSRPTALIHTWIDPKFFHEKNPRDVYLMDLPEELGRRGWQVVRLACLYNPGRSRRDAFSWLRRCGREFIIAEDYYHVSDYLWAFSVVLRGSYMPELPQRFRGMEISPMVREAQWEQAANIGAASFILYYRLIKRLAEAGFKPAIFIDTFENQAIEKPAVFAIRRYSSETRCVGFQHLVSPAKFMVQHYATPRIGRRYGAHPDVIVCNSSFTRQLYIREGFPEEMLRVGPSLRYRHLFDRLRLNTEPRTVFVGLSLSTSDTVEMIAMLNEAFPNPEGLTFWIQRHPMMPLAHWKKIQKERALHAHMQLVSAPMSEWVRRASCAVVGGSTAAMEFVLAGVPAIMMGRTTVIDFNPFVYFPELRPPIHTAAELRREILRATALSPAEGQRLNEWADWARRELLSPINDGTIAAFTEPMAHKAVCATGS